MHFATGPINQWLCPTYHPERYLVVPASSYGALPHAGGEKRDIFMYFKATCLQKPMKEPFNLTDVLKSKVLCKSSSSSLMHEALA